MSKFMYIFVLVPTIIFLSCDKQSTDPSEPEVTKPEAASTTTNSEGIAAFTLGPYDVSAKVKDEAGDPIANISTESYLLKGKIVIFAFDTEGRYYPAVEVVDLNRLGKPTFGVSAVIGMILITATVLDIVHDLEFITVNDWTKKICYGVDAGDALSVLTQALGAAIKAKGMILKLGGGAAQKLGYTSRTISIAPEALSQSIELFATVLTEAFHVLDKDVMRLCVYQVNDPDIPVLSATIPFVFIEDVTLNRDFEYKFTLTWGKDPKDLDSHLWTPLINGTAYHVYFGKEGIEDAPPYAVLDVDDVTSYGPENITIKRLSSGIYKYAVHHYDGTGSITASNAKVKVFTREGLVGEYYVPNGSSGENWWWFVGEINGATGAFSLRNQITSTPPGSDGSILNWRFKPRKE